MSFFEAQGSVQAENRQNLCEIYKVVVNSSIATMSAMGGSGDHCSLIVVQPRPELRSQAPEANTAGEILAENGAKHSPRLGHYHNHR